MKVEKVTIKIGNIELDVYQLPDGSYKLSKTQVMNVCQMDVRRYPQLLEKKGLKPILGKGYETPEKGNDIVSGKQVHLVTVEIATAIWIEVGDDTCKALAQALVVEALERRADAAFGVVRTEEERNVRVSERLLHRIDFHPNLTSWWQQDGLPNGSREYGARVNKFKAVLGLPQISIDKYDASQLRVMNKKETEYALMRKLGYTHEETLERL